jgi:HlyD family secretion protein
MTNMTMMKRWMILTGIIVALGLAGCSGGRPAPLEASGFIEADEISIVAETGGLVAEVLADAGEEVKAGQVLLHLDDSLLQSQRAEALAAVSQVSALRDEQVNGPRPEVLTQAEAGLAAAEAELDGAKLTLENAQNAVESPNEIYAQFAGVNAQAKAAAEEIELAEARVDEAQFWYDVTPLGFDVDENEQQLRQHRLNAAQAELEAAQSRAAGLGWQAGLLYEMTEQPLALIAQAHQAEAQVEMSEANVIAAGAQVDMLVEGPTSAERDLLDAQVRLTEAQLMRVDALIDQLTLTAPFDGVVTSRSAQVGETALPNIPLMTVADLESLRLVIYIPEAQLGRVQTGQEVAIRVDAYPLDVFDGEVRNIASEAEFTPRNIQTQEERVNLVFAIEIDIPNADGRLKPGMPADATIKP